MPCSIEILDYFEARLKNNLYFKEKYIFRAQEKTKTFLYFFFSYDDI